MSILRILANPADVGVGGFGWFTTAGSPRFDDKRVEGAFEFNPGDTLVHPHDNTSSTMWYHFRAAVDYFSLAVFSADLLQIRDANSNIMATMSAAGSSGMRASAVGATTASSGGLVYGADTAYSFDIQVIVGATIVVRMYVNGALHADLSVANTGTVRGNPASITFLNGDSDATIYISEVIIANEDTRGMRVRELRPKAFGLFQEWDGSVANLRDTDLSTGISIDVADRRVSFGITNIENVLPGDVINRVVCQSYAQRGETGLDSFNHFFRFRNGDVEDGADIALDVVGGYHIEEFATNPSTGLAWVPDDFRSLQSGVRSRA